jgi:hypothetical protein
MHSSRPQELSPHDPVFLNKASDIAEALCNLNYLMCLEAGDAGKVRHYATLSDERVRALVALLHPPSPASRYSFMLKHLC